MKKLNTEMIDIENPEWSAQDFARAKPAAEILPHLFEKKIVTEMLKPRGRPVQILKKAHLNLRLDIEVVEAFKAKGPGWQTRINNVLREWLREHRVV